MLKHNQFDALMDGERRPIPDFRIPNKYNDGRRPVSFHARPNFNPDATAVRRDQVFERSRTKWNYTFGFSSPTEDPRRPHRDESAGGEYGITIVNLEQMMYEKDQNTEWGIFTFITYMEIEHLFRNDLNDADRMGLE